MARNTSAQERMATAVKHAVNGLLSAIANRKAHPSYGYTKSYITEKWQVLMGLCLGYDVTFLEGGGASPAMSMARTLKSLGYDWTEIQNTYYLVQRSGRKAAS